MQEELRNLREQNLKLTEQVTKLSADNKLLSEKIQFLLKRLFGSKSEKLNRNQLEFFLAGLEGEEPDNDPPPPPSPSGRKSRRRERKPRLPEDLPTEDQVIIPDAVKNRS